MFFVFYLLVFTILQAPDINSFSIKRKINPDVNSLKENEENFNIEGTQRTNGSNFSTNNYIFEILQNLNKTNSPNLKSHVFDKMLSDELLTMKQQIYDKDVAYSSYDHSSKNKNNVPTPTLEIKQKWPVIDFLSKFYKSDYEDEGHTTEAEIDGNEESTPDDLEINDSNSNANPIYVDEPDENNNTPSENKKNKDLEETKIDGAKFKEKVIGLRSLYNGIPDNRQQLNKHRRCSCDNHNKNSGSCTPQCTGSSLHKCTRCSHSISSPCSSCGVSSTAYATTSCGHTGKYSSKPYDSGHSCGKCTRYTPTGFTTAVSYSVYPFYIPYQYVMQGQTGNPNYYYGNQMSNQMDEYYTREPKYHSTKHHKSDDYYYPVDDSKEELDDYLEQSLSKETKLPYKGRLKDVVLQIDYAENAHVSGSNSDHVSHGIYDKDKNKFVNEIVEDIKTYYPESAIKDCYCKSLTHRIVPQLFFMFCVLSNVLFYLF